MRRDDSLPLRLMEAAEYLHLMAPADGANDEQLSAAELVADAAANVVRDRIRAELDAPFSL